MAFTVLQLSDCHLLEDAEGTLLGVNTQRTFQLVLGDALSLYPHIDLIVLSGDISNDPVACVYDRIQSLLPEQVPCVWLPGNHDENQLMSESLASGFLARTQLGSWDISLLDSSVDGKVHGEVDRAAFDELIHHIGQHPDKHHAVFVHHQLISVGSKWIDAINTRNADQLLPELERLPSLKFIANGHVHQEGTLQKGSLTQFSTPSTCFQFLPKSEKFALDTERMPGFRAFKLHEDGRYETTVHRIPGQSIGLDTAAKGY